MARLITTFFLPYRRGQLRNALCVWVCVCVCVCYNQQSRFATEKSFRVVVFLLLLGFFLVTELRSLFFRHHLDTVGLHFTAPSTSYRLEDHHSRPIRVESRRLSKWTQPITFQPGLSSPGSCVRASLYRVLPSFLDASMLLELNFPAPSTSYRERANQSGEPASSKMDATNHVRARAFQTIVTEFYLVFFYVFSSWSRFHLFAMEVS